MKKTLFFIEGFAPTPEEVKKAAKLEGNVEFRNVHIYNSDDKLEKCDAVMGKVPSKYAEKFAEKEKASK